MSDLFYVDDKPGLDDPIWDYLIIDRMKPYIPYVRKWWNEARDYSFLSTGSIELYSEEINGLYVRHTRTAVRSPIKGIQCFPYVPTGRLQISGVQGGSVKMIERVCMGNRIKIDEFTLVCKSNLPSTVNASQFIAIIPTAILEFNTLGIWLYLTQEEIGLLALGHITQAMRNKAALKA